MRLKDVRDALFTQVQGSEAVVPTSLSWELAFTSLRKTETLTAVK